MTAVMAGAQDFAIGGFGGCAGCHAGPKWTISKVFYQPGFSTAVAPFTSNMQALQAAAWPASPLGTETAILPVTDPAFKFMRATGLAAGGTFDQILCTLRNVGTYDVADPGAGIAEIRIDMLTPAQGNGLNSSGAQFGGNGLVGVGYNVPSLLGMSTGAPYFHAGNARTLENLFNSGTFNSGASNDGFTFAKHHQALGSLFLSADATPDAAQTRINNMVQYLLSIDNSTTPIASPAAGNTGGDFCALP